MVKAVLQGQREAAEYDAGALDLRVGETVIVDAEHGPTIARVSDEVAETDDGSSRPKVIKSAGSDDLNRARHNAERAREALDVCRTSAARRNLAMKLVDVDAACDGSRLTFFFTAEARVDFRELVRELAGRYRTRIEMLQIGVRDAAKKLTGAGVCGRELCCAMFLGNFATVSIKMAKDQCLALNDAKVSGVCGRLKCCLRYEHDFYCSFSKGLPKVGKRCHTPQGIGRVTRHDPIGGKVLVVLDEGRETPFEPGEVRRFDASGGQGAPTVVDEAPDEPDGVLGDATSDDPPDPSTTDVN